MRFSVCLTVLFAAACHKTAPNAPGAQPGTPGKPAAQTARVRTQGTDGGTVLPVVVAATAGHARTAGRASKAGEIISVPAGAYHLGSTPGDEGRDPAVEADGVRTELPAFDIDALPFPNDPSQPMRTGASRTEAESLCQSHGRRLCSEIEWERACRGPEETLFPNGDTWDANACGGRGDPGQCASGFGALVMGARLAEWTRDNIEDRGVIRGAQAAAAPALHRCAARRSLATTEPGLDVAFRCCGGAAPNVSYPREQSRPAFREHPMSSGELAKVFEQVPELNWLRPGITVYGPSAVTAVMNHGVTSVANHPEVTLTVAPVIWSPTFGEEVMVLVANSGVGSFVAALWVLPPKSTAEGGDGRTPQYRHAGSFILAKEKADLALAYGPSTRERVYWHACFNCAGEYGAVEYNKETAKIQILQW